MIARLIGWSARNLMLILIGTVFAVAAGIYALAHLPLANTSAIFQALPLAITLGAAVIFGEPVGWRRCPWRSATARCWSWCALRLRPSSATPQPAGSMGTRLSVIWASIR